MRNVKFFERLRVLLSDIFNLRSDFRLYSEMMNELNLARNDWAFLLNAHLGDTYAFASLLCNFRKENPEGNVYVIGRPNFKPIFEMFDCSVIYVEREQLPSLTFNNILRTFYRFSGGKILPGRCSRIIPSRKRNMLEEFSTLVFHSSSYKPLRPKILALGDKDCILKKYSAISPGKTVIFSASSITVGPLPYDFWFHFVCLMKEKGYIVIQSVFEKEKEIDGAEHVNFDIRDLPMAVSLSGFFVSVRSGLCDLISGSNCRKVIIYNTSWEKRIYSLENYDYGENANLTELVLEYNREETVEDLAAYIVMIIIKGD